MVKNNSTYDSINVFNPNRAKEVSNTMKYQQLFLLFFLLPSCCYASPEQWQLRQHSEGIQIHQQPTKSGYAITRGKMEMKTTLANLTTLIRDRSTCQHWLHACKQGHLVKQYNPQQRLDYTVIDSPFWFKDRDMYTYSTLDFNPKSKTITIRLSGRENHDNGQRGRVRVKNLQGLWRLQQMTADKVSVFYQIYTNPQLMPSAQLDTYMVQSVFETLKNLNKVLQKKSQKRK
jgi:hypothetical protein